ncbi:MAG: hypothetical protein ACREF4_00780 [Gammaproteobacteria bacterium]
MAIDATEIYAAHPEELDDEMRGLMRAGISPLRSADFRLARTVDESRAINHAAGPVLIISASGMATGGRVLHHLRRHPRSPRDRHPRRLPGRRHARARSRGRRRFGSHPGWGVKAAVRRSRLSAPPSSCRPRP